MSTNNIEKNSRGLRAELKVYDDFMVGKEEFDKVIEAFANIPEKYIVPYDSLLYASSALKDGGIGKYRISRCLQNCRWCAANCK